MNSGWVPQRLEPGAYEILVVLGDGTRLSAQFKVVADTFPVDVTPNPCPCRSARRRHRGDRARSSRSDRIVGEEWADQLDYNLGSVFRACRAVLPLMIEQQSGSIINVSSTSGMRYTGSPQVGYASSKAGVIQFSRVTAVQYGPLGIRCNTVVPGQLHTPMVEARLAGQRSGGDVDRLLKELAARIPLPWSGDGRDTANAAVFLASDESRFVTGTEIIVDGGMSVRCD